MLAADQMYPVLAAGILVALDGRILGLLSLDSLDFEFVLAPFVQSFEDSW